MKKTITIGITAALCLLLLGACVKKDTGDAAQASADVSAQVVPTTAVVAATPEPSVIESNLSGEIATQGEAQAEATPGSMIIAESSNTISDSEKQDILDSLMGEIDSVLGSIDSLEDLDDSDLDTDDIE